MIRTKVEILKDLAEAVVEMEEEKAVALTRESLEVGIEPCEAIEGGLARGMEIVGRKYESGEYFIPQLLVCSDAMNAGIEILKPHMTNESARKVGTAVLGVVEGDIHDIGKNLVRIMLKASGFEVHDLGRDVLPKTFLEEAQRLDAQLICMSSLMTTAMAGMEAVILMLEAEGLRDRFQVLVGGAPVTQDFADRIGADGYATNATAAVKKAKELLTGVFEPLTEKR